MPSTIVIFGASGDLTSRKLIPALYRLFQKNRIAADTKIVGMSRSPLTSEACAADLAKTTQKFLPDDFESESWSRFARCISYQSGDLGQATDFQQLRQGLQELEKGQPHIRLYYLSTLPSLYETAVEQLGTSGLADESHGPRRIVIEKPFGHDLSSARALNEAVHRVFAEHQVYRIDHYLGKETVQNLLVLRFANSIFEPIWNRNYIDHVQITVAEEGTVGRRGAYYDSSGVLRDMFQNHLLQLMTFVAMEAPAQYEATMVRDEKVKVLRTVRQLMPESVALHSCRAQYAGYALEPGVASGSTTATFAAIRLFVDNWRWQGVPFYLRSGKAMSCRTTQIVIQFREPPHMVFPGGPRHLLDANRLVIQIQPAEGIQLHFHTKVPDAGMKLKLADLDFRFRDEFSGDLPDAYQRLLLDALQGDASLFARSDEVELAWSIVDPILEAWSGPTAPALDIYPPGQWGPERCTSWMEKDGRQWFDVCPVLR